MTTKKRKLVLLTSIMSVFAVAAITLFATSKSSSAINVGGATELIEGSITWTADNSEKTVHQKNKVSLLRRTARGTGICAYSYGQYDLPSSGVILDSKGSDYLKYGIFINSEVGTSASQFQFQNITSVSVTTAAGSASGATFKIYTDSTGSSTVAYTGTATASEQTFDVTTEVAGAKYLAVRPGNTYEILIKSITITYTCELN